jgi:hypothetical protein
MPVEGFPAIDFDAYHADELPLRISSGRGALATTALTGLGSLAFRMPTGQAFTYRPAVTTVSVLEGDAGADTVIGLDLESWTGLVHDYESAPGLLYSGRARCVRGDAMEFVLWEPALRAIYGGRPVYDPDDRLRDRDGSELDVTRSFRPTDDAAVMSHFLGSAGYLVVRRVFDPTETSTLLRDARALRDEAFPGDGASWWAKDGRGRDLLCRVTSARRKPHLGSLYGEPRIARLVQLGEADAVACSGEGDGVTVIYKNPGAVEGLSDLPWHRDCGLGGHALMCPRVIASVYLTTADATTGDLAFLPGSHTSSCATMDPLVLPRRAVRIEAEPGDVTIHYSDVMHAAPPPARTDLAEYRISVVTDYSRPDVRNHRGLHSYNAQLHARGDGRVEHLADVAKRA